VNAVCNPILDGGFSGDEVCEVLDGGEDGVVLDGGNAETVVC
jgi:hypothetical protein